MIVKSMSRKTVSFQQLLSYINGAVQKGSPITHNLKSGEDSERAVLAEFLDNSRYLPPRKDGNILYHEILSLSGYDAATVTPAILEDLSRHYLQLRAPDAIVYARAHFDTDCPHVHLMISANNLMSSTRLRLSRQEFAEIKRELERYQQQRYPQLSHSIAQTASQHQRAPGRTRREDALTQRLAGERGPKSRKEQIRSQLLHHMTMAPSGPGLVDQLGAEGLQLYVRAKTVGVQDMANGRKYRLRTLGIDTEFWQAVRSWERTSGRTGALPRRLPSPLVWETIRNQGTESRERERVILQPDTETSEEFPKATW